MLVLAHGPLWRRRRLQVDFHSRSAALRWLLGLDALVMSSSLGVSREFKEWLLTLFHKADGDSSGTVGDNELIALLNYLNLQLPEARAAALAEAVGHQDKAQEGMRFNDFFLWMRSYLEDKDVASGLYQKYASSKEQGLTRSEFVRLWREGVAQKKYAVPPKPVMDMLHQVHF